MDKMGMKILEANVFSIKGNVDTSHWKVLHSFLLEPGYGKIENGHWHFQLRQPEDFKGDLFCKWKKIESSKDFMFFVEKIVDQKLKLTGDFLAYFCERMSQ